jgi:4-hydroxy-tetrahydrodipicolinate reductase
MGSTIARLTVASEDLSVTAAVVPPESPLADQVLPDLGKVQVIARASIDNAINDADVWVDFTRPSVTMATLRSAARAGKPVVVGTTGFTEEQQAEIKSLATQTAILQAANMSLALNALFPLIQQLAAVLGLQYDVEIVETHHRHKKDAPSGTALYIERIIERVRKMAVPVHSLRLGEVVGEHTVVFAGPAEVVKITHSAQSRETFAQGALEAVRFLGGRSAGYYTMTDLLQWLAARQ